MQKGRIKKKKKTIKLNFTMYMYMRVDSVLNAKTIKLN